MRILDLGEAGYEGQSEAQRHYFYIDGDYDQDRGITDYDCDEITKQLVGMGLQAHCQADETRQGVVQIDTYSGRTTVQDGLAKAGYEAEYVPSPVNMAIEQAIAEAPKFTKADFDKNEAKNYHTENGLELAKAFGTPEEIEQMEQIAKNHYSRGHILSHEIDARNEIVGKYFPSLESQEEAMSKVDERELTKSEEDKKEDIVKGMKKNKDDFKKRYGDEAEAVMYATATKLAKENNANIFKTGANNAMSLANNMTKLHSKIDSKLANSPFGKTSAFKNYKATNQANKIAAMKQGVPYGRQDIGEDFMDDRKYQSLEELRDKLVDIEKHIKRLGIMDGAESWEGKTPTGTGDIHDQLTTMYKSIEGLQGAVGRALKVVPGQDNPDVQKFNQQYGIKQEDEINELDIKKNFQNIANKVGSTLSSIVKDKPVQKTNNKKFGNGSIAQKINWGGKYEDVNETKADPAIVARFAKVSPSQRSYYIMKWAEEKGISSEKAMELAGYEKGDYMGAGAYNWRYVGEELNELDLFAPKTDYIKTPDGQFYKIEYRNTGTVTGGGHGKNDKASFVSVNPASDKEVSALNLDDKIAKNDIYVHQGHEHQGGTPFSDRDIKVYNYGTDDYDEEVPNNAKMKLIKVMTTEAEKKKKSELGTKIRSWREQKADMKKKIEASKPGDKK